MLLDTMIFLLLDGELRSVRLLTAQSLRSLCAAYCCECSITQTNSAIRRKVQDEEIDHTVDDNL
jgi:hypothetical protein